MSFDTAAKFLGPAPRSHLPSPATPAKVSAFVSAVAAAQSGAPAGALRSPSRDQLDTLRACVTIAAWLTAARRDDGVLAATTQCGRDGGRRGPPATMTASCFLPSPYRFPFLVEPRWSRPPECVRSAARCARRFEKGDAEFLAALRAAHERELRPWASRRRNAAWARSRLADPVAAEDEARSPDESRKTTRT